MIHKNHTVLMVLITEVKSLKVLGLLDNVMFPIRFHLLRSRTPSSPPVGVYCQLYLSAFLFLFLPSEVASHSLGFLTPPQSIIWVTVLIRVIWTLKYFKNSYIFLHFLFFQFQNFNVKSSFIKMAFGPPCLKSLSNKPITMGLGRSSFCNSFVQHHFKAVACQEDIFVGLINIVAREGTT